MPYALPRSAQVARNSKRASLNTRASILAVPCAHFTAPSPATGNRQLRGRRLDHQRSAAAQATRLGHGCARAISIERDARDTAEHAFIGEVVTERLECASLGAGAKCGLGRGRRKI